MSARRSPAFPVGCVMICLMDSVVSALMESLGIVASLALRNLLIQPQVRDEELILNVFLINSWPNCWQSVPSITVLPHRFNRISLPQSKFCSTQQRCVLLQRWPKELELQSQLVWVSLE